MKGLNKTQYTTATTGGLDKDSLQTVRKEKKCQPAQKVMVMSVLRPGMV